MLFIDLGCFCLFVWRWLFVCLFKEVSLVPCLTCFTVGKEHPLFTYSRAPGLCSSNNLSQVIVSEPWDTWQANKGHTPPWNIYKKRTCSVNLPLHMHPKNGTWLPLTGCRAVMITHPISLLAYNHFKATPELMQKGTLHGRSHGWLFTTTISNAWSRACSLDCNSPHREAAWAVPGMALAWATLKPSPRKVRDRSQYALQMPPLGFGGQQF